ncbi:hypothetical protein [Streptomyces griseoluteus]|uniref:hypothetical protein n=1 Tax=Streptomyces griseoluteus TaxID=29306 RepID=UPI0016767BEB|nr:hypothetical protein [Streptomyces griseoluteus]GHE93740.1 hypothetical protein GCM10017776_07830 [Streptomyces griseoluteus]
MTQPPQSRAAFAPPVTTAIPAQRGPSGLPPARRTAFAEGAERLRDAATTEPGRLRVIGAVLALLVVAFGAVTAWQSGERATAADDVLTRSQPLSSGAAAIYRSLADANTAASTGFLAGPRESAANRERYEEDIRTAASGLVRAAADTEPGSASEATVRKLNRLLPEYKGLVERARVYNRQGYPVGGAYLRYANEKMQTEMLPAAQDLYTKENQRLDADYADATPYPWAAIALGLLALAALGLAQYRDFRRTNRVLNHGLVAASAATVVVLLWLVVGHTVARSGLFGSYEHGIRSLNVLHNAQIAALKARGNENLSLVARGAETVEVNGTKQDAYYYAFDRDLAALDARLTEARRLADDARGGAPVDSALDDTAEWKKRHGTARTEDERGNYQRALDQVIGADDTTGAAFDGVDGSLTRALGHEQTEFDRAAADGRDAMAGLPEGAAVLGVLGAAGAVYGIGRRLSEYR